MKRRAKAWLKRSAIGDSFLARFRKRPWEAADGLGQLAAKQPLGRRFQAPADAIMVCYKFGTSRRRDLVQYRKGQYCVKRPGALPSSSCPGCDRILGLPLLEMLGASRRFKVNRHWLNFSFKYQMARHLTYLHCLRLLPIRFYLIIDSGRLRSQARHSIISENVRPALCGVINAQDLERLPVSVDLLQDIATWHCQNP